MSPLVINIILSVPFILTVGITGAVFLVSGYKKGPWRALFSLGLTVVATVASLVFSRLLSGVLAGPIMNALPLENTIDPSAPMSFLTEGVIEGMIQVVLALVLFFLTLLILLIVFKCVGNRIKLFEKFDEWDREKKSLKFAGMGIRVIDTLVVAIMLLVPLYGALAATVVPVAQVQQMSKTDEKEESTLSSYVESVASNPLLSLYKAGPAAWVMGKLSSMDVLGVDVSLSDIGLDINGIITRFENFNNAEGEDKYAALEDLSRYTREKFVEKKWVYNLVCAFRDEVNKQLEQVDESEEKEQAKEILSLLNLTYEEFAGNAGALLDFITYALDNGFQQFYDAGDYTLLSQEFYTELGELLNYSKQARALKYLFLREAAASMYGDCYDGVDPDRIYDDEYYNSLAEDAYLKADTLLNKYFKEGKVPKEKWAKEGEAFMLIFFEDDCTGIIEAFARHPLFGADSVSDLVTPELLLREYWGDYYWSGDEESEEAQKVLLEKIKADTKVMSALKAKLKSYETSVGIEVYQFGSYMNCGTTLAVSSIERSYMDAGLYYNREIFDFLMKDLGKEYLTQNPLVGSKGYTLLEKLYAKIKSADPQMVYGAFPITNLHTLFLMAEKPELWPSQSFTYEEIYRDLMWYGSWVHFGDEETYDNPEEAAKSAFCTLYHIVEDFCVDEMLLDTFKDLVAEKGKDPFGLTKKLSNEQKKCVKDIIDMVRMCHYIDPSTAGSMLNQEGNESSWNGDALYEGGTVIMGGEGSGSHVIVVTPGAGGDEAVGSFNSNETLKDSMNEGYMQIVLGEGGYYGESAGAYMTEEEAIEKNAYYEKVLSILADFFGV